MNEFEQESHDRTEQDEHLCL